MSHENSNARLVIGGYSPRTDVGKIVQVSIQATGELVLIDRFNTAPSPSFLAAHPALPMLYAVSEDEDGAVVAFQDPDGFGFRQRTSVSTGASFPCHVAVDPSGNFLAATGYGDGALAIIDLGDDGVPQAPTRVIRHVGSGPHAVRQSSSHLHQAVFEDRDHLLVTDLGSDKVHRYQRVNGVGDVRGDWVEAPEGSVSLGPGTGPRHLAVHGGFRHIVGELDATLSSYHVEPDGTWEKIYTTATTRQRSGAMPSHVALHGGHLYVANRGPDTLAIFELDGGLPRLLWEIPCGGASPRHFAIAGAHIFVANERSHAVSTLVLTATDPIPKPTQYEFPTRSPSCVLVTGLPPASGSGAL